MTESDLSLPLRPLFPAPARVHASIPATVAGELFPEEATHVARAVRSRRQEYLAARLGLRRLLAELGMAPVAIPTASDRSPVFPAGVRGSISHTRGYCAVVLGPSSHFAGIGLDVETLGRMRPELWNHVLIESEQRWLQGQDEDQRAVLATLVYSAKECFYKSQYPITRTFLGFHDVAVEIDRGTRQFRATLQRAVAGWFHPGQAFEGHYRQDEQRVYTGSAIRPGEVGAADDRGT